MSQRSAFRHLAFDRQIAAALALAVVVVATAGASRAQEPAASAATDAEAAASDDDSVEIPLRLLERTPFDRITLNKANDNAIIETVLLDLPQRRLPDNLPTEGELALRRLSEPSIPYTVPWNAIAKIELFEHMLLDEAARLTAASEFAEAFEYLQFLSTNYPELPGLEDLLQAHLWKEASATFAAGDRDQAWPILLALYARNPAYPRLASAVQAVSDAIIAERIKSKNYAAARAVVDMVEQSFPKLGLSNTQRWRQRFQAEAEAQLSAAGEALAAKNYTAAREAALYAASIVPSFPAAEALLKEIQQTAPEVRVGVAAWGGAAPAGHTPDWSAARLAPLVDPRLVEMVDFGAEGGVYASRFGKIAASDDGLETTFSLSPEALGLGLTPDTVGLNLLELASRNSPRREEGVAANLVGIGSVDGRDVRLQWRRPPMRPGAILQLPLRRLTDADRAPGLWFDAETTKPTAEEARYVSSAPEEAVTSRPRFIVERQYDDDEAMLAGLLRGEIDIVDRVPPWHLEQAKSAEGIVLSSYRLPTVHVLIPNLDNPLLEMREFRRALCYAMDREGIVQDILLGGQRLPGFRTLSAPLPAGVVLNDPVGYGYDERIAPRPYEPRLGALLAMVARTTLAKRDAEARKEAEKLAAAAAKAAGQEPSPEEAAAKAQAAEQAAAAAAAEEPKLPPPAPLVLAHPADPVARVACQSIKLQLDQVGLPVKLVELPARDPGAKVKWDLLYAELAVWEPLVDARRLLGSGGVAGRATALMDAALDRLDRAENWNEARDRLKDIHRIAHYDLPLIPLWQTVNHFARRRQLEGVGEHPVSLYQNVADWRRSFQSP